MCRFRPWMHIVQKHNPLPNPPGSCDMYSAFSRDLPHRSAIKPLQSRADSPGSHASTLSLWLQTWSKTWPHSTPPRPAKEVMSMKLFSACWQLKMWRPARSHQHAIFACFLISYPIWYIVYVLQPQSFIFTLL